MTSLRLNKERHCTVGVSPAQLLPDIQTQNLKIPAPDFAWQDSRIFPKILDEMAVAGGMPLFLRERRKIA